MSYESHFIKLQISPSMIEQATSMANKLGSLNNSIRKGEGNIAGYLGQISVLNAIENMKWDDTYDYDLIWDNELKVEVKTKDRTVRPKSFYECSVSSANNSQKADIYVFVSLLRENTYTTAFILGYIPCKKYMEYAEFLPVGSVDPNNMWKVKQSCYNLPISNLMAFNHNNLNYTFDHKTYYNLQINSKSYGIL